MKTVEMLRDYDYCPTRNWGVRFLAGYTYRRVIEAATIAIVRAGAGRVVQPQPGDAAGFIVDARHAFAPRHRRR